jgi:PleD family two-component response regulator
LRRRGTTGDGVTQAAPGAINKSLRILLLEDNAADAAVISHELKQSGMTILVTEVDSAESFTAALKSFAPDVVLSDHSLAQFDARRVGGPSRRTANGALHNYY